MGGCRQEAHRLSAGSEAPVSTLLAVTLHTSTLEKSKLPESSPCRFFCHRVTPLRSLSLCCDGRPPSWSPVLHPGSGTEGIYCTGRLCLCSSFSSFQPSLAGLTVQPSSPSQKSDTLMCLLISCWSCTCRMLNGRHPKRGPADIPNSSESSHMHYFLFLYLLPSLAQKQEVKVHA